VLHYGPVESLLVQHVANVGYESGKN
jgi:hypothetical protein